MSHISPETVKAIGQMLAPLGAGGSTVQEAKNLSQSDALGAAISASQIAVSMASMFVKELPSGFGITATSAALANDIFRMQKSYNTDGTIHKSDLYSAASNLSAFVGTWALGVAATGTAVISAPVSRASHLSGFVANELSGCHIHLNGVNYETNGVATGDTEDEIRRSVRELEQREADARRSGPFVGSQ